MPAKRSDVGAMGGVDRVRSFARGDRGGGGAFLGDGEVNLCRHCTRRKAVRQRDLCFPCYGNRNIRRQYEPTTEFGRLCVEWNTTARSIKNRERPLAEPTRIPPGPDRVAVYQARNEM